MTNHGMSNNYFEQGSHRVPLVRLAYENKDWPIVVREAQEAVELMLKGVLRAIFVETLDTHNVAEALQSNRSRFPPWFARHIDRLSVISAEMAADRGPSFYGDEQRDIPPQQLFFEPEAAAALAQLEFVQEQCGRLIEELRTAAKAAEEGHQ
jgi:HEPN domain-containing protein